MNSECAGGSSCGGMGRTTEVARMSTGGCFPPPRQRFAIQVARKSARPPPPPIGSVKKQRLHRCSSRTTGDFSADDDDDESSSGDLSVNDGESSSEELSVDDDESSSALGSASPDCSSPHLASQESHVREPGSENLSLLTLAAEQMQLQGGCPAGSNVQATVEDAAGSPSHEVIEDSNLQCDEGENTAEHIRDDENLYVSAHKQVNEIHEIPVNVVRASTHVNNEGRVATHIGFERSSCTTSSLSLTGMAGLIDDNDTSEVDSIGYDDRVSINEYRVKPQNAELLRAIFSRYGDIGANCALGSVAARSFFMDLVCETLQELMAIDFTKITKNKILTLNSCLDDVEKEKIEVGWLKARLDEILEAKEAIPLVKPSSDLRKLRADHGTKIQTLREQITVYGRDLNIKMDEIHVLEQKIDAALQNLSQEEDEARKIDLTISECKAKFGHLAELQTLASGLV